MMCVKDSTLCGCYAGYRATDGRSLLSYALDQKDDDDDAKDIFLK